MVVMCVDTIIVRVLIKMDAANYYECLCCRYVQRMDKLYLKLRVINMIPHLNNSSEYGIDIPSQW